MKRYLLAALMGLAMPAVASIETIEMPVIQYSQPATVSVSISAYTNVTSSSIRFGGVTAVLVNNPSTNTKTMFGHLNSCSSTAVSTSMKGPIEIAVGAEGFIALGENVCLWLISTAGAPESVNVQGISQRVP